MPTPTSWGSRGREFKSRPPGAGQRHVPIFIGTGLAAFWELSGTRSWFSCRRDRLFLGRTWLGHWMSGTSTEQWQWEPCGPAGPATCARSLRCPPRLQASARYPCTDRSQVLTLSGVMSSVATLAWTIYTGLRKKAPKPGRRRGADGSRRAARPRWHQCVLPAARMTSVRTTSVIQSFVAGPVSQRFLSSTRTVRATNSWAGQASSSSGQRKRSTR